MNCVASILKAALPAILFAILSVLVWNILLALENLISPRFPWLTLCDAVLIALLWLAMPSRWARRPFLCKEPPSALILGAAITGVLTCALLVFLLAAASGSGIGLLEQRYSSQGISTTRIALWALGHAAVVEEFVFRGIFQPAIEQACGVAVALVTATLAFVLMHAGNGDFAGQWPFYALFSAVNGYLAWRSNSVVLPMAAHALLNLGVNGFLAVHGAIPDAVLRHYTVQLYAATLAAGVLFTGCVFLERLRRFRTVPE